MKETATLNDLLTLKADAALEAKLIEFFGPLEKWAYDGLHSGCVDHALPEKLPNSGYIDIKKEVWPPAAVELAKACLREGLRRNFREKFTRDFVAKVDRLQEQVSEIRDLTGV